MASLNSNRKGRNATKTHEGGRAISHDARTQLERSVMACMLWEDTFYESGESIADRIAKLSSSVSDAALLDIMFRAKEDMYLRHTPLYLMVQGFKRGLIASDDVNRLITRPDDMTELLSLYWKDGKKPLPAQMKKGLSAAFRKFDAYQLAKYNREQGIRLRDVLFLSHAKPLTADQEALYKQLATNTLPIPNTWEVRISNCKDNRDKKRAVWEDLLKNGPLGQLAFLRNLRNMVWLGVDDRLIHRYFASQKDWFKISPFQFLTTFNHAPKFTKQLEDAMLKACEGVPKLEGRTLLVLDTSESMNDALSHKSTISRLDTAIGLGIILREACEMVDIAMYGNDYAVIPAYRGIGLRQVILDPRNRQLVGYSTQTGAAVRGLTSEKSYDRIIVVTDEQSHDNIPQPCNAGYIINVGSYEPSIAYGKWTSLTGWSDKIVNYIAKSEA